MRLKPSKDFTQSVGKALKKASPTILTCIGAVGVVATAVLAVKATPKATSIIRRAQLERWDDDIEDYPEIPIVEKVSLTWRCYTPAAIAGIATIGCIFGANVLNRRQQASLVTAYGLLDRAYRDYRRSVKNVFGEEGHRRVLEDMAVQKVSPDHTIYTSGLWKNTTLDFNVPEEEHLFYDSFSDRHFTSTIGQVLQAEYHLNRNFAQRGNAALNEFYTFLGIDNVDGGDDIGWWVDYENEYYWVDFNHTVTYLDDGLDRPQVECLIIEFPDPPNQPWPDEQ